MIESGKMMSQKKTTMMMMMMMMTDITMMRMKRSTIIQYVQPLERQNDFFLVKTVTKNSHNHIF